MSAEFNDGPPAGNGIDIDSLAEHLAERLERRDEPNLQSMTPEEAVERYFEVRDFDSEGTISKHRSSLRHWVKWCEAVADIDDMSTVTGDDLSRYRVWRRDVAPVRVDTLGPQTERDQQGITRKFIEMCETFDAVSRELHETVIVPSVSAEDEVSEVFLPAERARSILAHLRKFEYATLEHVCFELLSIRGCRLGDARALDVSDIVRTEKGPALNIEHRPESETPLKNKKAGERMISISDELGELLDEYLQQKHTGVTDEYGRTPLLATDYGRAAKSTIRNYIYWWTQPCQTTGECPFKSDEDSVNNCDAAKRKNWASQCPGSMSCHPVRKGYITDARSRGVPKDVLSEECDVTPRVIDKHYDHRTKQEKMETRRRVMDALDDIVTDLQ